MGGGNWAGILRCGEWRGARSMPDEWRGGDRRSRVVFTGAEADRRSAAAPNGVVARGSTESASRASDRGERGRGGERGVAEEPAAAAGVDRPLSDRDREIG